MKSEIRKDYIQDKYVIIAPRRAKRPHDVTFHAEHHEGAKPTGPCFFCPEKLDKEKALFVARSGTSPDPTTRVGRGPVPRRADNAPWLIKVVSNKFPAVSLGNPKAYGAQEIVIETPDHSKQLEDLSVPHIAELLRVYAERTKALSRNRKLEYILIFKNRGGAAGANLKHTHSQIFATEFLPPHLVDKSRKSNDYKVKTGRCVFCDVIKKEVKGPRRIADDGLTVSFAPYASMYNYEAWILPRRHIDNITDLNPRERLSWARQLKRILTKITKLGLPYNFYFHQVVHDEDQHLYMKIVPRGSVWAGVEIGSGVVINPVPPEDAAKFYRS